MLTPRGGAADAAPIEVRGSSSDEGEGDGAVVERRNGHLHRQYVQIPGEPGACCFELGRLCPPSVAGLTVAYLKDLVKAAAKQWAQQHQGTHGIGRTVTPNASG
eukprot:3573198-Pyramimonas_sp.AAC.1